MENFILESLLKTGVEDAIEDRAIKVKGSLSDKALQLAIMESRRRGYPVIYTSGKLYLARNKKEFDKALAEEFRNNVRRGVIEYR